LCAAGNLSFFTVVSTQRFFVLLFPVAAAFFLSACATKLSAPMNPVEAYQQAKAKLPGTEFRPGSPEEKAPIDRFARFFGNLTEENAAALTRETYAEPLFFYDTLKVIESVPELEHYFVETARNTESVQARIEDVARSGSDYYVRWTMDIQMKKFRRGQTLRSVGMTHLRFNPEGKIILHHDYWDSTSGFFEHVPGLGLVIRRIKAMF